MQSRLEVKLRRVGILALEVHHKTPNQEEQGDMGWSTFESRDRSKKKFE
ncbi:MAG: hypothetical protein O7D30_02605 [Rickettsia endosymbiont of Ixodes persulcatus]|nr:hypothetical protein [Rickettsia endosymbiont of Ixodes persulcatus]